MSAAQCPINDRACSYAYGTLSCRCGACRDWNSEKSRRRRERRGAKRRFTWSPETRAKRRYAKVWKEADAAFRTDPFYIVAMAEKHRELVSANAQ